MNVLTVTKENWVVMAPFGVAIEMSLGDLIPNILQGTYIHDNRTVRLGGFCCEK